MAPLPETYLIPPTPHVPNSPLPALLYRDVLGPQPTADSIRDSIEKNRWMKGGVWKAISTVHFHSVTHECYGVFKGRSRLVLGRGPLDDETTGVELDVGVGDVLVVPAGVSHASLTSEDEYEYVGLYPEGSPKWDNNYCKAGKEETAEKAGNARRVPVPNYDPVYGEGGPLVRIWRDASAAKV